MRRFEVLLPLEFNDGRKVPPSLVRESAEELREKFGAVSVETRVIHGEWVFQGAVYRDNLVRLVVDMADTPEHLDFFRQFKERLKVRFAQLEIWIVTHPIQVL
jgi:hypothetical protein